jgi:MFS family permease
LFAPFVEDVLQASAAVFGLLITVQALGGIIAGLIAAQLSRRISTVAMYGSMEIILGAILFVRYNITDLPVQFLASLLTGLVATLGVAALETLFQQKVPNSHLGRISGALNTTVGFTSLFGVLGISGVLGEALGIVPVLNIAAAVTLLTGLIALVFLPNKG